MRPCRLADSSALGDGAHHHPTQPNQASTFIWRFTMTNIRNTAFATIFAAVILAGASGCAVTRGQETVGAYVDDATITTQIKSRFVENKDVDASSIHVETL